MKPKIVAIVVAAVLLAGGGAFALMRFVAPSEDDALAYVPSNAYAYSNFFINPSNSQKGALDEFLQKFPGIDSTEDVIEKLTNALDDTLAEEGLSYEEDLEPWLGDQIAIYGIPGASEDGPNGAVLIESTDEAAARDFVDKVIEEEQGDFEQKTYEGTDYELAEDDGVALAFLDGFMAVGSEDAIKASIDTAAGDETLETSDKFTDATSPLRDDWIGLYYLDTAALFEEIASAGGVGPEEVAALGAFGGGEGQKPQAGILYVTADSAVVEMSGSIAPGPFAGLVESLTGPGILPDLPGEAWAAFGVPALGDLVTGMFESLTSIPGFDIAQAEALIYAQTGLRLERDVLSWMGDLGFFVQGANLQEIGGGLVVESTDPAKTTSLVRKLAGLVRQQGLPATPLEQGGLEGFSLQIPGVPAPVAVLGGDRLAITYGDAATDAVAGEGETLAESEAFSAAQESMGEGFNAAFFVDVDAAQAFGEAIASFAGGLPDTYTKDVKPVLDVFTHVVGGTKKDGDSIVSKFVVGVE